MPAITPFKFPLQLPSTRSIFPNNPSPLTKFKSSLNFTFIFSTLRKTFFQLKSSEEESAEVSEDEWLQKLPEKNKPLYSHSLPCLEAWLKKLRFYQSRDDRAVWFVENPDWHAQVSLDVTDLYIRYMKNGPGNLEKDVERRFSYALSREDIEKAILGGP